MRSATDYAFVRILPPLALQIASLLSALRAKSKTQTSSMAGTLSLEKRFALHLFCTQIKNAFLAE